MVLRGVGGAGDAIYKDVGGLQQRIPEEAVGAEIFVVDVVELVIVIVAAVREFGELVSFSWKLTLPPSGVEPSAGLSLIPFTRKNP